MTGIATLKFEGCKFNSAEQKYKLTSVTQVEVHSQSLS